MAAHRPRRLPSTNLFLLIRLSLFPNTSLAMAPTAPAACPSSTSSSFSPFPLPLSRARLLACDVPHRLHRLPSAYLLLSLPLPPSPLPSSPVMAHTARTACPLPTPVLSSPVMAHTAPTACPLPTSSSYPVSCDACTAPAQPALYNFPSLPPSPVIAHTAPTACPLPTSSSYPLACLPFEPVTAPSTNRSPSSHL